MPPAFASFTLLDAVLDDDDGEDAEESREEDLGYAQVEVRAGAGVPTGGRA